MYVVVVYTVLLVLKPIQRVLKKLHVFEGFLMNRTYLSTSEVSWCEQFTVLNGREGIGLHPLAVTSREVVD